MTHGIITNFGVNPKVSTVSPLQPRFYSYFLAKLSHHRIHQWLARREWFSASAGSLNGSDNSSTRRALSRPLLARCPETYERCSEPTWDYEGTFGDGALICRGDKFGEVLRAKNAWSWNFQIGFLNIKLHRI